MGETHIVPAANTLASPILCPVFIRRLNSIGIGRNRMKASVMRSVMPTEL